MSILERIHGHEELVSLNDQELGQLCAEIRGFLVDHVSQTGGHLASNLGVVELTVAIETVFNTNIDRLVFDVGHQSYVHKILTGRQADFEHLRQFGGIAGFPKPSESDADAFVAGHASSSVSIALGMARARTMLKENYDVVALLGDGAATGGMVYEGLNDAAVSKEPMIVILNDNQMSIDKNVGGMARHLSNLRTKERYLGMKKRYRKTLTKVPGGTAVFQFTRSVKDWIKRVLIPTTLFENMGFTYLGPVDGHDLHALISLLRSAKGLRRPVLLHVLTKKGHGYLPAETHPSKFHGVGQFDAATGFVPSKDVKSFSDAFGEKMLELAQSDSRMCAITAAMPGGTGLLEFKEKYPNRLFDVGIAEEHAVSMAGGLAKQGIVPVVAIYSTFLQRAYDQILQDVAILNQHVVFAVDRAGLVGEDGETHHGLFDVGFLRQAPGMTVLCPISCQELGDMLEWAVKTHRGPVAIRYPRGGDRGYSQSDWNISDAVNDGALKCHRKGKDITILTYGTLLDNVMGAAELLEKDGVEATVLRLLTVSPLPVAQIIDQMGQSDRVLIVEETQSGSGIYEALHHQLQHMRPGCHVLRIDLGKHFVTHGSLKELYRHHGMDSASIAAYAREVCQDEN